MFAWRGYEYRKWSGGEWVGKGKEREKERVCLFGVVEAGKGGGCGEGDRVVSG